MELFDFAYCPLYREKIATLASLSPEKWSFEGKNDNYILSNYLSFTFKRLSDENKVIIQSDYALINTGLFDEYWQPIYGYFVKNKIPDRQTWVLDGFYNAFNLARMNITDLPERADYFTDPSELVFDTRLEIRPQYDHIFGDQENIDRLPANLRLDKASAMRVFTGAIEEAKKRLAADYKSAVPQFYRGHVQLLIPLFLSSSVKPDLALACEKTPDKKAYFGSTCLTLEMAYNNARLIAKPESSWLKV